jgi:cholesterol oxidase
MSYKQDEMAFDYDFIIVGSGFGGSVSALRLAEKGYSVCVLERGKRYQDSDFPKNNWDLRRYLWMPLLKCFGIQNLSLFRNILILSGTGVGGGSLVYANTLLQPENDFFTSAHWKDLANWKEELEPYYLVAKRMLGVTVNPQTTAADQVLRECAQDLGREDTFRPAEVGVFFGEPGKKFSDPYFDGSGPDRHGCIFCGGCMIGCRHNAKNTLVKNYLYFAEKLGVTIIPERNVDHLKPLPVGYEVHTTRSTAWFKKSPRTFTAKNVVLAGGVLGTVDLLLKCKYQTRSMPLLSSQLGCHVRTNSEAIVGISQFGKNVTRNFSEGVAITSIFHPDAHTHIEPVRYPKDSNFMRVLAAPMTDGNNPWTRPFRMVWNVLSHPLNSIRIWTAPGRKTSTIMLLVMQTLDSQMRFQLGRNWLTLFRKKMTTFPEKGHRKIPSYIPIANEVGRSFAKRVHGVPMSAINEVLLNIPTTAHILGGCSIGASSETGVVDSNHRVFEYPGLYVCDGSVIPGNLGVNPSLTITAMSERAMSRIPESKNKS